MFRSSLGYSTFIYAIICIVIGVYYAELTDVVFNLYAAGMFMAHAEPLWNNSSYFFGLNHIMSLLYNWADGINWYGLTLFLAMLMVITLSVATLRTHLQRRDKKLSWPMASLVIVWTTLLLLESATFIQFTTVSLLLSAFTVLYLHVSSNSKQSRKHWLLINGLLIFSLLIRVEGFAVGLLFPLALLFLFDGLKLKSSIKTMAPALAVAVIVILLGGRTYSENDRKYEELKPYFTSLWDFEQAEEFNLANKRDSVMLESFQAFFFGDLENLDEATFEKLNVIAQPRFSVNTINQIFSNFNYRCNRMLYEVIQVFNGRLYFFLFIYAVFLSMILLCLRDPKRIVQLVLLLVLAHLFILVIAFYIKMEYRLVNPILVMATMVALLITIGKEEKKSPLLITGIIILTMAGLFLLGSKYQYDVAMYKEHRTNVNRIEQELNKHPQKIVFMDAFSDILIFKSIFDSGKFFNHEHFVTIDNAYINVFDAYDEHMEHHFGSANFGDILRAVENQKDNYLFISTIDRVKMINRYATYVHGSDLDFCTVPDLPVLNTNIILGHQEFYLFEICDDARVENDD